jgi:hypothetical protein
MPQRNQRRGPRRSRIYYVRKTTTERRTNHVTRRFVAEMSQKAQAAGGTGSREAEVAVKPQKKLRLPERVKRTTQEIEAPIPVCIGADQTEP